MFELWGIESKNKIEIISNRLELFKKERDKFNISKQRRDLLKRQTLEFDKIIYQHVRKMIKSNDNTDNACLFFRESVYDR